MKRTWKLRLASLLLVICLLPVLSACAKSSGKQESEAKAAIADDAVESVMRYTEQTVASVLTQTTSEEFAAYREQGGFYLSPPFDASLARRWADFEALHGKVTGAKVTEGEKEVEEFVSHLVLTGEDGEMMRLNIKYAANGAPVSSTLEKYADDTGVTLAGKLAEAGVNTVIGLGVVFSVLVLLTLVISAFQLIGGGKKQKAAPAKAPAETVTKTAPAPAPAAAAPAAPAADDAQIAAVIAAAIAAAEGTSTDAFVVRSIRKVKRRAR